MCRTTADAVSAYTQVKLEDEPPLLNISKSECPDIWIRLPRHKWPKSRSSMEDPVVPLERNLHGHPLAGLLWERQFEKVLLKHGWERVPNWECLFVHREKELVLSVYVDDIKLAGKKQNLDPMWKVIMKDVGLGEPTFFLDHVYLGCTQKGVSNEQRYCGQITEIFLNPNSLLELRKSCFTLRNLAHTCPHGPMIWKVIRRNAWKDTANWRTKATQQLYKVATPCIEDHQFKEEELGSVGEMSKVCPQIVLKCLYLARIGRLNILWSVNILARAITKWTRACDKRLARLISHIHHTCEYRQCCHVGNTAQLSRFGLFSGL